MSRPNGILIVITGAIFSQRSHGRNDQSLTLLLFSESTGILSSRVPSCSQLTRLSSPHNDQQRRVALYSGPNLGIKHRGLRPAWPASQQCYLFRREEPLICIVPTEEVDLNDKLPDESGNGSFCKVRSARETALPSLKQTFRYHSRLRF